MVWSADESATEQRGKALKFYQQGNYKLAYEVFRKLSLDPKADPKQINHDLKYAMQCLTDLGRVDEQDELREAVAATHAKHWRALWAVAESYLHAEHHGYIIAGAFERGHRRGEGRFVTAYERDRVRALQLLHDALGQLAGETDQLAKSDLYFSLSQTLIGNRGWSEAWRLQTLTKIDELPDYEDEFYAFGQARGAPVGPDGQPIFHRVPKSYDTAASDGERWRWALLQAMELSPARTNELRWHFAEFLQSQFGVQTLMEYQAFFYPAAQGGPQNDDAKSNESGIYALHTLAENETIAKLATGVKRFKLPDEFNYIKIYQAIADNPKTGMGAQAIESLAEEFENRRQYPRAAVEWKRCIQQYGPGEDSYRQKQLDQIVGNWGQFEALQPFAAGRGAKIDFRFRNGNAVKFEAYSLHVDKLLTDVKEYLKTRPKQLEWEKTQIDNIGYRLVEENQKQYLGAKVAEWNLPLTPRANHVDQRITVSTPLQKAGAYLLKAQMADGNLSQIVVWLADTAIVRLPVEKQSYYFIADAATGAPIAKANVEFFGFRQQGVVVNNRYENQLETKNFAEFTDADGQVFLSEAKQPQDYSWLITARTLEGRFAYLGFHNVWRPRYHDPIYRQKKVFALTDRPVYRPGHAVKYKLWVGEGKYDQPEKSQFANKPFRVEIYNAKGEKAFEKNHQSDAFGGLDGEWALPSDAPLGVYSLRLFQPIEDRGDDQQIGIGLFRVEEYKKPEYEVTVEAPKEPVQLGEQITAMINARYYFGAPVTQARVKYKVLRTAQTEQWFPICPWDWMYGPGYWWYAYECHWLPGFRDWGCRRPTPWWWGEVQSGPPEVIAEVETDILPDGTVPVTIDTAIAKAMHGDRDHTYQIVAEVIDQSRRTIVGEGNVMVARKPFKVYAWVDRGYYRTGDDIQASFKAHTLDKQPVAGQGKLELIRLTYDKDAKPVETPLQQWELNTDDQGAASLQIKAAQPGQYRLSYRLTDGKGHMIEGGYVFTVIGQGVDGADFRFNDLELVNDKREYQPGDTVKLQINSNRLNPTILLFPRPADGVYLPPKILRVKGKSVVEEIAIAQKDMPNIFVEAVTVFDGRVHSETKEIIVPPEKRVLNVTVTASGESYRPGQAGSVKIQVTDFAGKPFVGSTVLSVYDKSVEYIAGGTMVPDIKEFFWKWRRSHHPQVDSNLARWFQNLVKSDMPAMQPLGLFGNDLQVENLDFANADGGVAWAAREGGKGMVFGGIGGLAGGAPPGAAREFRSENANGATMLEGALREQAVMALSSNALGQAAGAPPAPAMAAATVRKNFADTAKWVAAITTDADGTATIPFTLPESLTTWKARVWTLGAGTRVGSAETEFVTRKDLIVRLQAPRFFVEKDEVFLTANVHNYLKAKKSVQVTLELEGNTLAVLGASTATVDVDAGGEHRVDFRVKVTGEGQAVVRVKALTDVESDAVQMSFPAYIHGMLKTESWSGVIRPDDKSAAVTINVPKERRINDSRLEIRYSPTLAGAMVDALPYLVDYPHGCTEQTLNRFLPTVVTQKILLEMGLDLKTIADKRTNLNAQELGDDVERAKGWKRFDRNPVFDQAEVVQMVKDGLQRLTEMQNADGGWGWFSGLGEHSWPHTTAYVVHGLQLAQRNDVALVPGTLEQGLAWLERYQNEQVKRLQNAPTKTKPYKTQVDNLDAFVYMVLVDADKKNQAMLDFLYRDRTHLAVYTKAMFGLALERQKEKEKLDMILQNIEQYVVQDAENQTAYLKLPVDNFWWYWYGSEYEAHGYYLKLLSRTQPKSELASRLVKYLLNNRKHATYWNSTRDTAICVEALADYLKASGENQPNMTIGVYVDGQKQKEVKITAAELFTFDNKFVLHGDAVTDGQHRIELRREGVGPVYFNAYLTNFTLEDPIAKAGLEIKVERKYYKLNRVDKSVAAAGATGQVTQQKVEKYERQPLENLATLKSGDLVEIELEIESKNDYEYLLFEDMKAAGFEPVDLRSGYNGNSLGAYMELRDERVAFFVRALTRGKHSVSYRMRAEIPGKFSALPTRASAMYAPELKANSDELKLAIEDR